MQPSPEMRVGVAWYSESEWDKIRAIAADRDDLETTYLDWVRVFTKGMHTLAQAGVIAEPVAITAADLKAWCEKEGRGVDSAARSEFASLLLYRRYEPESAGGKTDE
jgi:hypothetical protein